MKKAYIKILSKIDPNLSGCAANISETPLPGEWDLIVEDIETLPKSDPLFWEIVDSKIVVNDSEYNEFKRNTILEELLMSAKNRERELRFDASFVSLLDVAKFTNNSSIIAKECSEGLDNLWDEYKRRKKELIEDYDFSGFGYKPNSYSELKESL